MGREMTPSVLIVEDEIFVASDIARILEDAGYRVAAIAADRKEALEAGPKAQIALVDINLRDGITVITNLHTLDTARAYCERIIGMAQGKVVFDGTPDELTTDVARTIYGADGLKEAFSEAMTSTSIAPITLKTSAQPAP